MWQQQRFSIVGVLLCIGLLSSFMLRSEFSNKCRTLPCISTISIREFFYQDRFVVSCSSLVCHHICFPFRVECFTVVLRPSQAKYSIKLLRLPSFKI